MLAGIECFGKREVGCKLKNYPTNPPTNACVHTLYPFNHVRSEKESFKISQLNSAVCV